jgi:hypothetical protein
MALGKCKECGRECAQSAKTCPGCGVANPVKHTTLAAKLGLVFVVLVAIWLFLTSGDKATASTAVNPIGAVADLGMEGIKRKVATDAVAQYEIAKRNGTPMDVCAQAGMVSAAFLQVPDEASYSRWKQTEKTDCAAAGVPR